MNLQIMSNYHHKQQDHDDQSSHHLNFLADELELSEGPLSIVLVLEIGEGNLVDTALQTVGGDPGALQGGGGEGEFSGEVRGQRIGAGMSATNIVIILGHGIDRLLKVNHH